MSVRESTTSLFDRAQARLDLPPPPWLVGHRGAPRAAPENTIESLAIAVAEGADMVEVDLQLTADGELVACHDRTLERLAGRAVVVEEARADELCRIELAAPMGGGPYRLARLGEMLEGLPPAVPLNLELKRYAAGRPAIAEALASAVRGRQRPLLVSSFDHRLLEIVGGLLPGLPLAPIARQDARALAAAGRRLAAWSLHCRRSLASTELAAAAGEEDRPLLAYTVNAAAEARHLLGLGVCGLFTDRPLELRRELEL